MRWIQVSRCGAVHESTDGRWRTNTDATGRTGLHTCTPTGWVFLAEFTTRGDARAHVAATLRRRTNELLH